MKKFAIDRMTLSKNPHGLPPMRTCNEMAEEFGIPQHLLAVYLRHYQGPEPTSRHKAAAAGNQKTYYNPSEMRKWWKSIQDKIK